MSDRYAAWIRDKLAEHAPAATSDPAAALQLAHAWAALSGHGKQIFGMEMPAELADREAQRTISTSGCGPAASRMRGCGRATRPGMRRS
jgi:hypothetical protein